MFARCYLEKYVDRLRGSDKNIEIFSCPACRSEFTLRSSQDVAGLPSNYGDSGKSESVSCVFPLPRPSI